MEAEEREKEKVGGLELYFLSSDCQHDIKTNERIVPAGIHAQVSQKCH